ncbi:hypothetical protein R1flu_006121 [Riccia fluitans]|uniref:Uncharacterized protein n=1 Tax=Riccia fluitans TaxID=41844 RepID=A0ABD1YZ62_9MARC
MAEFVREIARLREELLAKDAKLRDLQKSLQEQPGEVRSEQLESARKEFHDVEQRFALVESLDLSDTFLPSFSLVLVETLRKTLDAEFDLMRQLQSLEQSQQEKEATDKQVQELATQLERAQFQLEKVRKKANLKAAFADLDTVQSQLDEEHERNSKLHPPEGHRGVLNNDPRGAFDSSPAQLPTISSADGFQGPVNKRAPDSVKSKGQVVCLSQLGLRPKTKADKFLDIKENIQSNNLLCQPPNASHRVSTTTSDPRPANSGIVPGL